MKPNPWVAVLNLTPDSFSDGGCFVTPEAILQRVDGLIDEGAGVIDIGAQSTRPHAEMIDAAMEWQRLQPVLAEVISRCHARGVLASIDTIHPENAARAVGLGVDWVNDVNGFADADMVAAVKNLPCKLVVMHSLTVPADPAVHVPLECDVVKVLLEWFDQRADDIGVDRARLIFDAGIGFGKTAHQSLQLVLRANELKQADVLLLIGHSRKSFLSLFTDAPPDRRDDMTLAFSAMLLHAGVNYLRVHNVARHVALFKQPSPYGRG